MIPESDLSTLSSEIRVESARPSLTVAESEVLALLARGLTNQQIAEARTVTPATVATQIQQILRKTGCANRTDAALWMMRREARKPSVMED